MTSSPCIPFAWFIICSGILHGGIFGWNCYFNFSLFHLVRQQILMPGFIFSNPGVTRYILRLKNNYQAAETVKVRADYVEIVALFKNRLNDKYLKGLIDKDEAQLFYFSNVLSRSFSPS